MWVVPGYLKLLLLPPANLFVLALVGLLFYRRRPRLARALIAFSFVGLYVLSTPLAGGWLLRSVEDAPPLTDDRLADDRLAGDAGAIIVLSAGAYAHASEYDGETVGWATLERLRYAVRLHRLTGLPLLVTGGRPRGERTPIGVMMAETLAASFGITPRWVEPEAVNTYANATLSAAILHPEMIDKVFLVTHAWHMRRATAAFEAVGFEVVPAPINAATLPAAFSFTRLVPSAGALGASAIAFYEWIGLAWYRVAYF